MGALEGWEILHWACFWMAWRFWIGGGDDGGMIDLLVRRGQDLVVLLGG